MTGDNCKSESVPDTFNSNLRQVPLESKLSSNRMYKKISNEHYKSFLNAEFGNKKVPTILDGTFFQIVEVFHDTNNMNKEKVIVVCMKCCKTTTLRVRLDSTTNLLTHLKVR